MVVDVLPVLINHKLTEVVKTSASDIYHRYFISAASAFYSPCGVVSARMSASPNMAGMLLETWESFWW